MSEQITATTIPPTMYGILTEGEFRELKEKLSSITTNLPNDLADFVWNTYTRIKATREPKPCMCKSSGGLWAGAVDYLRNYVTENDK
jgi:hypothetical protein